METYNLQLKTMLPTTNGIFSAMERSAKYTVPWEKGQALDLAYIAEHSGEKITAPIVRTIAQGSMPLDVSQIETLADLLLMTYHVKWDKLYATMSAEYDPLNNYDMTEESEDTTTDTGTVTDNHTMEHGETITNNTESNTTQDGSVYGFNSTDPVPNATQSGRGNGTDTTTHSGTDTDNNTKTLDTTNTMTHKLIRKGNIGVTSSQQLLQSERDLWQWNYWEQVFQDVDSMLTLAIY